MSTKDFSFLSLFFQPKIFAQRPWEVPSENCKMEAILSNFRDITSPSVDILASLAQIASENASNQEALGEVVEKLAAEIVSERAGADAGVAKGIVTAMVKLCRREMDKSTSCVANCARMEAVEGCFEGIVKVGSQHAEDAELALNVCWLIAVLCSDSSERQTKFANAGAPEEIVRMIAAFTTHAELCMNACRAIRNLSILEETSALLVKANIAEALFDIMTAHAERPAVLECVAWAVVNLSCDSSQSTILGANRCCSGAANVLAKWASAQAEGANEAAVLFLRTQREEAAGLPLALCWAIRNLSCSSSSYNLPILHNTDVCAAVVQALKTFVFEDDASARAIAMHCLANLACHGAMSKTLVDAGAAVIAVQALRDVAPSVRSRLQQPDFDMYDDVSVDLAEAALSAVRNLASGQASESGQTQLLDAGAVAAVAEVLALLYVEETHADAALGAVVNLVSDNPEARVSAGEMGLCEETCKTLEYHPGSEQIGEMGAKALAHLCMGGSEQEDNRRRTRDAGAVKIVNNMMYNLRYSEPSVRAGCDALLHAHFMGYTDGPGDEALKAEVAFLREKEAIDENDRAVIHDWTFDEVKDAWLGRASVVAIVGEPRITTSADRKAAADAAAAAEGEAEPGTEEEEAAMHAALTAMGFKPPPAAGLTASVGSNNNDSGSDSTNTVGDDVAVMPPTPPDDKEEESPARGAGLG